MNKKMRKTRIAVLVALILFVSATIWAVSIPQALAGTTNFGQTTMGTSSSTFSSIRGARYTCTTAGPANSIGAYLGFTPTNINIGNINPGSSGQTIANTIRGEQITTPASQVTIQSISAYIHCSGAAKNMKAAIYDDSANLVATTDEISVPAGGFPAWRTFTFASPPTLAASTNCVIVVWSASGSGSASLYYTSKSCANGLYSSTITYGSWPSPATFTTNTYHYCIYCTVQSSCTITASAGSNGAISPSGSVSVNYNQNQAFNITPNTNYHVADVLVDGSSVGAVTSYTFNNVVANHAITASFAINTYSLTVTQGAHGTISPSTTTVNYGGSQTFSIAPDAGYHIVDVQVDGVSQGAISSYPFTNVQANHAITASFAITQYQVTFTQSGLDVTTASGTILTVNGTNVGYSGLPYSVWVDSGDRLVYSYNATVSSSTAGKQFVCGTVSPSSPLVGITSPQTVTASYTTQFQVTYAVSGNVVDVTAPSSEWVAENGAATGVFPVQVTVGGSRSNFASDNRTAITEPTLIVGVYSNEFQVTFAASGNANSVAVPSDEWVNAGQAAAGSFPTGLTVGGVKDTFVSDDRPDAITMPTTITGSYQTSYYLTVTQGDNGVIAPGTTTVNYGSSQSFTITASTGYHIVDVVVDGASKGAVGSYTISNVQATHTITASFAINTYAITVTQGANGLITGPSSVNYGADAAFTIAPSTGYHIVDVLVNGSSVGAVSSYTFNNVTGACSITAAFAPTPTPTATPTPTPTPTATPTPTPTPSPSPTPSATTVPATTASGATVDIAISGNVTAQQMSNMTITPYQSNATTTVAFTITGTSGTVGFVNMTIPKTAIPYGTTPIVYIDGQQAQSQGYSQDADNFYVWCTTHFSTHQVEISFTAGTTTQPQVTTLWYALVVIVAVAATTMVGHSEQTKAHKKQQSHSISKKQHPSFPSNFQRSWHQKRKIIESQPKTSTNARNPAV